MKIKIYSVAEKSPPINESIMRWHILENGMVSHVGFDKAMVAIPDDEEELQYCRENQEHETMTWGQRSMKYDDYWSHSVVSRGE